MGEQEKLIFQRWAKMPKFQEKVRQAKQVIKEAIALGNSYVAWSLGKDSSVLLHLAQSQKPDIPAISFTHPEREMISNYAETQARYCDRNPTNLIEIAIDGDHIPNKIASAKLWEKYPVAFVGLRKEESKKRRLALIKNGEIYQTKNRGWRVCPLANWQEIDIWAYTIEFDIPYLAAYDLGAKRTTDHVSKNCRHAYQSERLEEFRILAPNYYQYLKDNFPETFYAI